MASLRIVMALSLLSLLTHPAFSKTTCKSMTFSDKKTFDNCMDLPTLSAVLHWTYNPSKTSLSMAFTAPPPASNGWVSWALNPKADGMAGAQALIAFKPKSSGSISVNTYDIASYAQLTKGPISYNVSSLSAEESSGKITIFGTWVIPAGEKSVNQVWQVGPVVNGNIAKHEFKQANLESKMRLSLSSGASSGPAGAPAGSPTGAIAGSPAEAPAVASGGTTGVSTPGPASARQSSGAGKGVVSVVLALGALVVSLV